jgi:RNA polymerase sigma factor (sigma-70 family)
LEGGDGLKAPPENPLQQPLQPDAALAELLTHRAKFLRFLGARVGEPAAEDILQSAFIRAVEKGNQIQHAESVTAWFYRLLRNAITDHYRREAARNRAHELSLSETPVAYEHELQANICQCVGDVMQSLKDDYRVALERVDMAGDSIGDFAIAHGTTPNNVSVRLHRARKAAAKKLTQVCGACAEHKCLDCTCKKSRARASA